MFPHGSLSALKALKPRVSSEKSPGSPLFAPKAELSQGKCGSKMSCCLRAEMCVHLSILNSCCFNLFL